MCLVIKLFGGGGEGESSSELSRGSNLIAWQDLLYQIRYTLRERVALIKITGTNFSLSRSLSLSFTLSGRER